VTCSAKDAARLVDACRLLVASLDLDEVVDRTCLSAAEILGAEFARLATLDDKREHLVAERLLAGGKLSRPVEISWPAGRGLAGIAAATGEANICTDAGTDRRFDQAIDGVPGAAVRSVATSPMEDGGRLLGVLQVLSSRANAFRPKHQELLERFAGLAATAIARARSHRSAIAEERSRYELTLAAEIQKSLLPTRLPDTGSFEFDAVCLPAQQVGGDLYDIFPFPDGRICAVLGDVSGKGVPAALYMTWMVAELRLLSEQAASLAELMSELNRRLRARSTRGIFVTLMAGLFSPKTGQIEVASAGHHPPLLRRASGNVEEVPYPSAPPLGIVENQRYPTTCLLLAPGEAALGFTDGVIEALNPQRETFGLGRLKEAFAEGSGPGTLMRILKRLARFAEGTPPRDDTTMVLMWRKDR
jgi:sigma-B regulation protein RsbU (phosphoserine phosphatase)